MHPHPPPLRAGDRPAPEPSAAGPGARRVAADAHRRGQSLEEDFRTTIVLRGAVTACGSPRRGGPGPTRRRGAGHRRADGARDPRARRATRRGASCSAATSPWAHISPGLHARLPRRLRPHRAHAWNGTSPPSATRSRPRGCTTACWSTPSRTPTSCWEALPRRDGLRLRRRAPDAEPRRGPRARPPRARSGYAGRVPQCQERHPAIERRRHASRLSLLRRPEAGEEPHARRPRVGVIPRRVAAYGHPGRLRRLHPELPHIPGHDLPRVARRPAPHRRRAAREGVDRGVRPHAARGVSGHISTPVESTPCGGATAVPSARISISTTFRSPRRLRGRQRRGIAVLGSSEAPPARARRPSNAAARSRPGRRSPTCRPCRGAAPS